MKRSSVVRLLLPLAVFCLAGASSGCATSLTKQLDWHRAERERLIGTIQQLENELSLCRGQQDGLKDKLVELRLRLDEMMQQNHDLRTVSADMDEVGLSSEIDPGAEDAFRDMEGVSVDRGDEGEVVLTVDQAILFDSGSVEVSSTGRSTLVRLAQVLKREFADRSVRVEGHTDNVPVKRMKKRYPSNWELSTARACAVLRVLTGKGAVSPASSSVAGFADQHPVADNSSEEGRRKNRRVEIVIVP